MIVSFQDLERVWVTPLPGPVGCFDHSLGACELDPRFVLAETTSPEMIAATIVHEATHARLHRRGIGYEEDLRGRVEAVCVRRQLAFAARLPNGEQVREQAERDLEWYSTRGLWTNQALIERRRSGEIELLRYLGFPDWLIRATPAVQRVSRFARGLIRRNRT